MFRFILFTALAASVYADSSLPLSRLRAPGSLAGRPFTLDPSQSTSALFAPMDPEAAVRDFDAALASAKVQSNQAVDILSTDRVIPYAVSGIDEDAKVAISTGLLFQNTSDRSVTVMIEFYSPEGNRIAIPTRNFNGEKINASAVLSGTFSPRAYQYLFVDASRLREFTDFWVRLRTLPAGQVEVFHETMFTSLERFTDKGGLESDLGYIALPADRSNTGKWIYYMPPADAGAAVINVTNGYAYRNVILTIRARMANGTVACNGQRIIPINTSYSFDPTDVSSCFANLTSGYLLEVSSDRSDLFSNAWFFTEAGQVGGLPRLVEQ